jgi:hypothetical protein
MMTTTITDAIPLSIDGLTWRKITDQIVTAIEGGSGYWATSFKPVDPNSVKTDVSPWYDDEKIWSGPFKIAVRDGEEEKTVFFTPEGMKKGLQWLADNYLWRIEEIVKETGDAETADVFLQACIFQDIVYG